MRQFTDDKCYAVLKHHYDKLGEIPTKKYWRENKISPSYHVYYDYYDGIVSACDYFGIQKKYTKEEKIYETIEYLKELYLKNNKVPTVYDFNTNRDKSKHLPRRTLEKYLGLKWNDICQKYLNVPVDKLNQTHLCFDKNDIIKDIKNIRNKLNNMPTYREYKKYGGKFSYNIINRAFNKSFTQLLLDLDMKPKSKFQRPYDHKSDKVLLKEFKNIYKKLGEPPLNNEYIKYGLSHSLTYKNRFGSIENLHNILNLEYTNKNYAGKICYDKNNELCKSEPEMIITNFLIDNNIDFNKEVYYKDVFDCNVNYRADWLINNEILVEYFGMYNGKSNSNHPIRTNYNKRTKKKIKLLYKKYNINKCIFIFPNDLEYNNLNKIFKTIKEN